MFSLMLICIYRVTMTKLWSFVLRDKYWNNCLYFLRIIKPILKKKTRVINLLFDTCIDLYIRFHCWWNIRLISHVSTRFQVHQQLVWQRDYISFSLYILLLLNYNDFQFLIHGRPKPLENMYINSCNLYKCT